MAVVRIRAALSDEEWEALRQMSEADLRSYADEVRFLIRQAACRRVRRVRPVPDRERPRREVAAHVAK